MRQILLALICLSTLAGAQNVLAIAPVPGDVSAPSLSAPADGPMQDFVASHSSFSGEVQSASSTTLLIMGLAGLTLAGGRRQARSRAAA